MRDRGSETHGHLTAFGNLALSLSLFFIGVALLYDSIFTRLLGSLLFCAIVIMAIRLKMYRRVILAEIATIGSGGAYTCAIWMYFTRTDPAIPSALMLVMLIVLAILYVAASSRSAYLYGIIIFWPFVFSTIVIYALAYYQFELQASPVGRTHSQLTWFGQAMILVFVVRLPMYRVG
jgi:hypothetical protein